MTVISCPDTSMNNLSDESGMGASRLAGTGCVANNSIWSRAEAPQSSDIIYLIASLRVGSYSAQEFGTSVSGRGLILIQNNNNNSTNNNNNVLF